MGRISSGVSLSIGIGIDIIGLNFSLFILLNYVMELGLVIVMV